MKFSGLLDDLLGQRSKVMILRYLVRTGGEHTGRDLARALQLDHKTCHAALGEMAQHGVVQIRRLGKALIYTLHREHAVMERLLTPLFKHEEGLIEDYARDAMHALEKEPESIIVFGSVARGEEEAHSDVDLLFIMRDKPTIERLQEQLDGVTLQLTRRYSSVPQIMLMDRSTFRKKAEKGDPLIQEILRTGRVLHGKQISKLLTNVR